MSNTIKGRLTAILPKQVGTSKTGKDWSKQDFVVETEGEYPKSVCFTAWGDKLTIPAVDSIVTVSFDPESREYNGRWYTDLKAWKIDTETSSAPAESVNNLPDMDSVDEILPF